MTEALAVMFLLICTIGITVCDFRWMIIPDTLNTALGLGGFAFSLLLPSMNIWSSLAGAIVGGGGMWLFRGLYIRARRVDPIGLGDVKFLVAAGLWVGVDGLAVLLFTGSVAGLLYAGWLSFRNGASTAAARLPFGPFLCVGLLVAALPHLIWQRSIFDLVLPFP